MYTKACTKSADFLCTRSRFWSLIGCRVVYVVSGQQSLRESVIYFIHQVAIHNATKLLLTSQIKLILTVTPTLTGALR